MTQHMVQPRRFRLKPDATYGFEPASHCGLPIRTTGTSPGSPNTTVGWLGASHSPVDGR